MNFIKEVTSMEVEEVWSDINNYELPYNIQWYNYEVFKSDVKNIHHIRSENWGPVAGIDFRVEETMKNLKLKVRNINESDRCEFINHKRKIQKMLNDKGFNNPVEGLILIATDTNDPFTILDGNHRFAANFILNSNREDDYIICKEAYVGISAELTNFPFLYKKS
jgi:hypothetical protein